jgi:hypothetical protein
MGSPDPNRRQAFERIGLGLGGVAAGAAVGSPPSAHAAVRPVAGGPAPGLDLKAVVKVLGRLDGAPTCHQERGALYGLRPGEPPRLLLAFDGCAIRRFHARTDGGFDLEAQSWVLFRDPATGETTDVWLNPYTLETVAPAHMRHSDPPVRLAPRPGAWTADWTLDAHLAVCVIEMGAARDLRTVTTSRAALDDWAAVTAPAIETWTRTSAWPAFLNMANWSGQVLWRGSARKVDRPVGLDAGLSAAIEARWPGSLAAAAA